MEKQFNKDVKKNLKNKSKKKYQHFFQAEVENKSVLLPAGAMKIGRKLVSQFSGGWFFSSEPIVRGELTPLCPPTQTASKCLYVHCPLWV